MASLEGSAWRVQQNQFKPFDVIPIANARVRYSRVNTTSTRPITIASLDFEITPLTNHDVILDKADLTVPDGRIECLTKASGFAPPVTCRTRDNVTLLYRLTLKEDIDISSAATTSIFTLDICIKATVLLSDDCQPKITMQWRTNIDFSVPVNPLFGAPMQSLQRPRRPSNSSVTTNQGGGSISNSIPDNRSTHSTDSGITISFSGPRYVHVGEEFHWDVFIVNKSSKPRKFVLAAMPKRKMTDARKNVARPSSTSSAGLRVEPIAEAVTDDNFVYAMQKNGVPYDTDLVCLNMDVRAGPLPPGTCHLTKLKMLPLIAGPLQVEAVKVVDLMNNDSTTIKDLPDIIALAPTGN
ncbi:hypothetical protein KEM54_005609 [Ascosphaera aggregata]|nr:hypothetical protein KEM54_005609 [Ascosphaera aggregata]